MATVPTRQEINTLSDRAIVAFAARCGRRVQPLFRGFWPDADQDSVAAVEDALAIAERFSIHGCAGDFNKEAAAASLASDDATNAMSAAVEDAGRNAPFVCAVAITASVVATCTELAIRAIQGTAPPSLEPALRETLVNAASNALSSACIATGSHETVVARMRSDFEKLRDLPISPDLFGPFWPNGIPSGWRQTNKPD